MVKDYKQQLKNNAMHIWNERGASEAAQYVIQTFDDSISTFYFSIFQDEQEISTRSDLLESLSVDLDGEKDDILEEGKDLTSDVQFIRDIATAIETVQGSDAYLFDVRRDEVSPRPIGKEGLLRLIDIMDQEDREAGGINFDSDSFLDKLQAHAKQYGQKKE